MFNRNLKRKLPVDDDNKHMIVAMSPALQVMVICDAIVSVKVVTLPPP